MSSHSRCWALGAVLVAVLVAPTRVAVQSGPAAPGRDWTHYGGNATNQRFSPLTQINTQNVKSLGGAWSMKFEGGASTRATPMVKDGIMYVSAGSRVYALNAKTGAVVWTWRPSQDAPARLETAGIGDLLNAGFGVPNPPGVSLGEGFVFVGLMDGNVAALREKTGEVVWTRQIGYEVPRVGQAVSGTPAYANGILFAGLANGDWAFRGKAVALDAKTGNMLWEFYTIPDPGQPGHNTWPPTSDAKYGDIYKQGGGGIWHPPSVDPELGLVYYTTGNAVPMFGGEARRGDNLYTGAAIALEMKTGRLRWHYQVVHHDLWDADIAIPHILYDTQVNGQPRKALAAMRADGYLFLLDRETGKPILPIEERPVTQDKFNNTSPTQPYPVGADGLTPPCDYWKDKIPAPFVLDCGGFTPPFIDRHNVVGPNVPIAGSNRVTPMSYSPQTGYFYAQGSGSVGRARRISTDPFFRGNAPMLDLLPPSVPILAAIDSRTNKIVWKKDIPPGGLGNSGPLTTAGGLMFRGDGRGLVQAYDARTGNQLWEYPTGVTGARGPAMTYEVDGEQYLAIATGTALFAFKLGGTPPPAQQAAQQAAGGGGGRGGRGGVAPRGTETNEIETATLVQSADRGVGARFAVDEHAFNPIRARAKANQWITFVNNGAISSHTIAALDGSFQTPLLKMAESASIRLGKPGTYRYACKEHPWAIGELTIE